MGEAEPLPSWSQSLSGGKTDTVGSSRLAGAKALRQASGWWEEREGRGQERKTEGEGPVPASRLLLRVKWGLRGRRRGSQPSIMGPLLWGWAKAAAR